MTMATTQKISVAMGRDELRLAKSAADAEGVSLSAYITRAVRQRLEERQRLEAAREVLATFAPAEFATPEEQRELLALWSRAPMRRQNARAKRQRHPQRRRPS
jgi:hypothetical protein